MKLDFNLGNKQIIAAAMTLSLAAGLTPVIWGQYDSPGSVLAQPGGHKRLQRQSDSEGASEAQVSSGGTRSMDEDQKIAHLLNRVTFGARPGDVEKVKQQGIKNYIAAQLNPDSIAESPEVVSKVQNTDLLNLSSAKLIADFKQFQKEKKLQKANEQKDDGTGPGTGAQGAATADAGPGQFNGKGKMRKKFLADAQGGQQASVLGDSKKRMGQGVMEARLVRAIDSNRQLQEVMTDFWYNHFNICIDKGLDRVLVGAYEEQAIRPFALGKFRDLVGATCHHPAMLFYLDNWQNSKPGSMAGGGPKKKGKESGLNENYARELMELHTLGVDGGYTQKDVQELARVLTGLGLAPDRRQIAQGMQNAMAQNGGGRPWGNREAVVSNLPGKGMWGFFNEGRHDFGEKVVLGQRIAGTGEPEIEQCLDMLCKHPATAHHIAFQLAQYFVADEPPKALVDRLAAKFTQTDGDIKAVMTSLLDSPEFWDGKYNNDKYKSPFRYTVSVFRATDTEPQDYQPVIQFLRMQGQPLYGCLTPDGYKNTQSAWLNPDALINRINFATAIGTGKAKFMSNQPVDFSRSRDAVNAGMLSAHTESVISKAPPPLKLSLLIGSPEFMRY